MGGSTTPYSIREITEDDPDYIPAIHIAASALSGEKAASKGSLGVLLQEEGRFARIRPVVGCYAERRLCYAVAGVETGASSQLLVPFDSPGQDVAVPAIRHAISLLRGLPVAFVQIVSPSDSSNWEVMLRKTGFQALTNLEYLARPKSNPPADDSRATADRRMTWISYSDESAPLFVDALQQSYEGSMDCPEIQELRSPAESLASHRAAGEFNPNHWQVLLCDDVPVGVLLLSRLRQEQWTEIIYMGVSQPMRRSGVAKLLMSRAIRLASADDNGLILAVDIRNLPARRLYARFGFTSLARRTAWIAKLGLNER